MSQEYIEITDKTVDDAITTACQRLLVTSSRLDYIVVQREKSGFLGIGAKPAIIKARVKDAADATQAILDDVLNKAEKKVSRESGEKKAEMKHSAGQKRTQDAANKNNAGKQTAAKPGKNMEGNKTRDRQKAAGTEPAKKVPQAVESSAQSAVSSHEVSIEKNTEKKEERKDNRKAGNVTGSNNIGRKRRNGKKSDGEPVVKKASSRRRSEIPDLSDEKIEEIKQTADQFLRDVFKAMEMEVEITENYDRNTGILTVNMEGDDMGVLIGKRGQTLDSLQYLVSLVVNKGIDGYIHVKADTENYRERRKKTLENLAGNIAQKVKKERHSVELEPMNPYERRIIHSALQGDKYIITYSEGEEPYRKVIVDLKKDENGEILLPEYYSERGGRGRNGRGGRNNRGRNERRGRNDSSRARKPRRYDDSDHPADSVDGIDDGVSLEMVDEIIAGQNAGKVAETAADSENSAGSGEK